MTSVALVDCIASADRFMQEPQPARDAFRVVSLHPVVQEYFTRLGIECVDIASFIDDAIFARNLRNGEVLTLQLVKSLDLAYSAELSSCLGIKQGPEWFSSLYRHPGKYELGGILNGIQALARMLETTRPSRVVCFGVDTFSALKSSANLQDLFGAVFSLHPSLEVPVDFRSFNDAPMPSGKPLKHRIVGLIADLYELRNYIAFARGKPLTILLEHLYDLKFLRRAWRPASSLIWRNAEGPSVIRADADSQERLARLLQTVSRLQFATDPQTSLDTLATNVLASRIHSDLSRNAGAYASALLAMKRLVSGGRVERLIWGADPNSGFKALIVDYLLKSRVEVVGCLHGNGYGTHVGNEQNQSAHSRCTSFLSYGYTRRDVEETSTDAGTVSTDIVPVGSYKIFRAAAGISRAGREPRIDLFYPITNNYSLFLSSQRTKVDSFLSMQRAMLASLDNFPGSNIVVKLPPPTVDAPGAMGDDVRRAANLRTTTQNVLRLMQQHEVGAVLIDANFSMCMLELMPFDCEMFVMHDPVIPVAPGPLALLEKRVHYLYSAEQFDTAFRAYMDNTLERRRDPGFMNKYIFAGGRDVKADILAWLNGNHRPALQADVGG